MKIAHIVIVNSHLSGLCESARDLVMAERALGEDARIIDPKKPLEGDFRGAPVVEASFADECDIIINHSGLVGKGLDDTKKPIILAIHGRPRNSFLLEWNKKVPVYTILYRRGTDPRYVGFVTFWPEHLPFLKPLLPRDLHCAAPPVNLSEWVVDGPQHNFSDHAGDINVVVTDTWRDEKDPYYVVNAFLLFAEKHPGARLHLYAAPKAARGYGLLMHILRERGALGEVRGYVNNLAPVYRAADMMVTQIRCASRTVREALACGCQVVMGPGNDYTPYTTDAIDVEAFAETMDQAYRERSEAPDAMRARNRQSAEKHFDPAECARVFLKLAHDALQG